MDELSKDPELASEFVKLFSAKLNETRKALDESKQVRRSWSLRHVLS